MIPKEELKILNELNKISWKKNISSNDNAFIERNINKYRYLDVFIKCCKIIMIHNLTNSISNIENTNNFYANITKNYLKSKNKIHFIKNELNKREAYYKKNILIEDVVELPLEYLIDILIKKQIIYNEKNKKYSTNILGNNFKDLSKLIKKRGYFDFQSVWLAHKKKAKDKNWPIADENGK